MKITILAKRITVDDRKSYVSFRGCPIRLVFEDNEYVGWYYAGDDAVEMLKNEEIRENTRKSEWIPVAERIPDWKDGKVLVFTKYGFSICERTVNGRWQGQHANWITHWMPLPEPPKEGE